MKYVSTKKNIVAHYGMRNIIEVPYADLQNLLRYEDAEAYTSGVYGWNADVYGFGNRAICTGYRPFGGIKPSREVIRKYDDAARALFTRKTCKGFTSTTFEELKTELRALADAFVLEVAGR